MRTSRSSEAAAINPSGDLREAQGRALSDPSQLVGMTLGDIVNRFGAKVSPVSPEVAQQLLGGAGTGSSSSCWCDRKVIELGREALPPALETLTARSFSAAASTSGSSGAVAAAGPSVESLESPGAIRLKTWTPKPDWQRDGCKYWGSQRAGRLHGLGRIVYADGSTVEGEFRDGEHIQGVATYPNGAEEWGRFSHGYMVEGTRKTPEGVICEGIFEEGSLIRGVEVAPNGTRREGLFRLQDGARIKKSRQSRGPSWFKGTVELPEKEVLRGEFHEGLLEGEGSIRAGNGIEWIGPFHGGMPEGLGTVRLPDGRELKEASCFPRWVGAMTAESSFHALTSEQLMDLETKMGGKDPLIPLAILFSFALKEDSLELFEQLLPLALLGWARSAYPCLMKQAQNGEESLSLRWFCQLLALKERQLCLALARAFVTGVQHAEEDAESGESFLAEPYVMDHAAGRDLLRPFVGPVEKEEEVQSKLLDLLNLRDEPYATVAATLFGSGCIRWEDLDPSHPADRQLMWRCLLYTSLPVPEATQWVAGLSEQDLEPDFKSHFVPGWFFDQWIFNDALPVPVEQALGCQSPLHLLALARVQGFYCQSAQGPCAPEHRVLAEPLSILSTGEWETSGPQESTAQRFLNSLLGKLSLWSDGGEDSCGLFGVAGRLAAAALFYCPVQAPVAWNALSGWRPDQSSAFLGALSNQIKGFHQEGHTPRNRLSARDPALFLCSLLHQAGLVQQSQSWIRQLRAQALESAQTHPHLLMDYRKMGVLSPALRFLWAEGFPLEECEQELLMSEPALLEPADLQRVLFRMKKSSWEKLFREGPLERLLPAFTAWAHAGFLPQTALERRAILDKRCLQQPALLDQLREEGVLPAALQPLWSKGLPLTPQEAAACIMNPGRYPGVEWRAVTQFWPAAMWARLLDQCGPVAVLHFLVEQLQGRPLKQDRAIAEMLVQACLRAPAALQPYRHHQVLDPRLQELWSGGLPMNRAEVFALFDSREIRRELLFWPSCVKRWPESSWAALLLERGLPEILALLNEREAKEWSHLSLVVRRGLTVGKGGMLVSPAKGSPALAREHESPSAAASMPAESSAPVSQIEFRLTRQVVAQIGKLKGLRRDAVRLWLSNAAVGWYAQERPTTVEKDGRSWMHAHVIVPGGGICIIGYWRDRTGSRCTVGWLMERHNYAQLLSNALAQAEQINDTVALEEARLTPQAEASVGLPYLLLPARESENDQTYYEEKARLMAALRGDRMAYHGSPSEHDLRALRLWRQRAGLGGEDDLPLQDSLEELESWLVTVVEQFYDTVGAPAKPLNRQRGPHGYAIYRFQKIWSRSMHAVSRFFPGREHEVAEWSDMLEQLGRIAEIVASWPQEWWPQGTQISLSSWMQLAARCDAALDLAGVPVEQRPVRLDELTRLSEPALDRLAAVQPARRG